MSLRKTLRKILRSRRHRNLALVSVIVIVAVAVSFIELPTTYAVEQRPMNAQIGTTNVGPVGWCYNMGYNFTPTTNGYVDKLWYNGPAGTATLRLYLASTQALLASASVSGVAAGTWVSANITSVNLTSGTSYVVAVSNASCQLTYTSSGVVPITQGNITLNYSVYDNGSGSAFPTNNGGATWYGTPDISFNAGSPQKSDYVLTSSQSGNFNLGTTWGGPCASSCTAGTDYPATTDTVTIASGNTVTLSANQTVDGMVINTGGAFQPGSYGLTVQ